MKDEFSLEVFLNLLKYAYLNEILISLKIFFLLGREKGIDEDVFFKILEDNEKHRLILQKIFREISFEKNFSINELEKEIFVRIEATRPHIDNIDIRELEKQAYLIYKFLHRFLEEKLGSFLDKVKYEKTKKYLLELMKDEEEHQNLFNML